MLLHAQVAMVVKSGEWKPVDSHSQGQNPLQPQIWMSEHFPDDAPCTPFQTSLTLVDIFRNCLSKKLPFQRPVQCQCECRYNLCSLVSEEINTIAVVKLLLCQPGEHFILPLVVLPSTMLNSFNRHICSSSKIMSEC